MQKYKSKEKKGLDCCSFCSSRLNSGENNPSFKYHKNENYFSIIDCEDKAYLLGWIAADGSIRARTLHVELHEKDEKILKYFIDKISPETKISKRNRNNCQYITISSLTIINDLCKSLIVNPGNKQNKLTLPLLSDELKAVFMHGFFEGDGWISEKNNSTQIMCGIASICPNLRNEIYNLSFNLNIKCSDTKKAIEWYGENSIKFMNYIYNNATMFLDRKYNTYLKWKNIYEKKE